MDYAAELARRQPAEKRRKELKGALLKLLACEDLTRLEQALVAMVISQVLAGDDARRELGVKHKCGAPADNTYQIWCAIDFWDRMRVAPGTKQEAIALEVAREWGYSASRVSQIARKYRAHAEFYLEWQQPAMARTYIRACLAAKTAK